MSACVLGLVGASSLEIETLLDVLPDWKFRALQVKEVRIFGGKTQVGRRVFCGSERLPVHETKRKDLEECDVLIVGPDAKLKAQDIEALCQAAVAVVAMPGAAAGLTGSALQVAGVNSKFSESTKKNLTERPLLFLADDVTALSARLLKPLISAFGVDAAVIASYESASGAGRQGFDIFHEEMREFLAAQDLTPKPSALYPWPMAFNVFSMGATGQEKVSQVTAHLKEVLERPDLRLSCQLARVPAFVGHAVAMTVSLGRPATLERVATVLKDHGFAVNHGQQKSSSETIASLRQVHGQDVLGVSDLRVVDVFPNGLSLWLVADNLRMGIAVNALGSIDDLAAAGVLPVLQKRRRSR